MMTKYINDVVSLTDRLMLKNRVVLAPITLSVCQPGGYVSEDDISFYKRRACSVGLVITGSAYIHPQGQAFANSYSVAEDDKIQGLSSLAKTIQEQGAKAILQLYHGGRMVPPHLIEGLPVAPSAVKGNHGSVIVPRPLKSLEVDDLLKQFLDAIRRAEAAGFDGVELHGANTYLIQQFFSPHSNIRQDKWGGSFNNRLRFPKTLLKRAKQLVKLEFNRPFVIGYRFSPEEIEETGITLWDSLQLIEQLIQQGVDYLHISSSDVWRSSLRDQEAKSPIIKQIISKIKGRVPLIASGNIHTIQDVEKILSADIPLFSVGKALLLDPDWTQKIAEDHEETIIRKYQDRLQEQIELPIDFVNSLRSYLEEDA